MNYIKLFFLALPLFVFLDILWIGLIAKDFYYKELGALFTDQIQWSAAIAFYLLYTAGVVFFVIEPAPSILSCLFRGAFFGLVAYATYDLTNMATLKGFSWNMVFLDLIWGALLTGASSTLVYFLFKKFNPS